MPESLFGPFDYNITLKIFYILLYFFKISKVLFMCQYITSYVLSEAAPFARYQKTNKYKSASGNYFNKIYKVML